MKPFVCVAIIFLAIICSRCSFNTEFRISKWLFWDHFWLSLIIFAIIAIVLKRLSQKTCPDCLNTSVPKYAKVCQKCGYRFTAKQQDTTMPSIDRTSEAFETKIPHEPDHKPNGKKFSSREDYEKWRDEQLNTVLRKKE